MAGLGIDTIHELTVAELDQLAAVGVTVVSRYISRSSLIGKILRSPEYMRTIKEAETDRIVGHPAVDLVLNYEQSGKEWRQGYAKGLDDGKWARAYARGLGWPDDRPITQSIDEGVPASLLDTAFAYQRGFNDGNGGRPQGCYGPGDVVFAMLARGLISVAWQWMDGTRPTVPGAHVRQRYRKLPELAYSHDVNDLLAADVGQHPAPAVAPPPDPTPLPTNARRPHGMLLITENNLTYFADGFRCTGIGNVDELAAKKVLLHTWGLPLEPQRVPSWTIAAGYYGKVEEYEPTA